MAKKGLKYILLTDVVGSRKIKDRPAFEKMLAQTLQHVQKATPEVFEIPIQVWKGLDETAALLKQPWQLYRIITHIASGIAPFAMRFVLVKGEVDLLPKASRVAEADGPAFHTAATQMLELKKSGMQFSCHTGNERFDKAWQAQVNLLWLLKQDWTERQRSIYDLYCETGLQDDVAKKLKITQQNVSKALKSISAAQVLALEKGLTEWTEGELKNNVLD